MTQFPGAGRSRGRGRARTVHGHADLLEVHERAGLLVGRRLHQNDGVPVVSLMEGHGDACQQVNHRLVASDLAEKEAKGREEARVSDIGRKTRTCTHHDVQTQERDAEGRRTRSSRCELPSVCRGWAGKPSQEAPEQSGCTVTGARQFLKHLSWARVGRCTPRGAGRDAVDLAAERESDPRRGW